MNIELSGHHVDVTDGMREIVEKKFKKFGKRYDNLTRISLTVKTEKNLQSIEAVTQYFGHPVSASAKDANFYKAVEQAATKMEHVLEGRKGSAKANNRKKPEFVEEVPAAEDEVFDE